MAPEVGLEPTTNRLTADRSTTELLRNNGRGGRELQTGRGVQSESYKNLRWIHSPPLHLCFMASAPGATVSDSLVVQAENPDALGSLFGGVEKELERCGGLDPLIADKGLKDFALPRFLTGDDAAHAVSVVDIPACLIEELRVLNRVPRGVAVVEFNFVERVGIKIKQDAEEKFLGDSLDDEDVSVLDGFAFDHPGLHFGEAFLQPLRGLAPLEIKWHADFLLGPCGGKPREQNNQNQKRPESEHREQTLKKTSPLVNGRE